METSGSGNTIEHLFQDGVTWDNCWGIFPETRRQRWADIKMFKGDEGLETMFTVISSSYPRGSFRGHREVTQWAKE